MQRTAGYSVMLAAAFAAASAAGAGRAPSAFSAAEAAMTPAATGRVRATGRGRLPRRAGSEAQRRLMARRAAVVEAYKNAAMRLGMGRSVVSAGTGTETVNGFIRGVELIETRYYRDGGVEAEVEFTVPAEAVPVAPPAEDPRGGEEELLMVEKGGGPMPEEEWREILGGGGR